MKIIECTEVDSKEWLEISALAEGEYAHKVLNDVSLQDIGKWGHWFSYIKVFDDNHNLMAITTYELLSPHTLYGVVVLEPYRNQGVCDAILKYCINKNSIIELNTKNPAMMKVAERNGLKCVDIRLNTYSNKTEKVYSNDRSRF